MALNEFAKLEEVQEYLKISNDTYNKILKTIMANCQSRILTELGRDIFRTTYTSQYYTVRYPTVHVLLTKQYPIQSITTLTENTTALTEDTNFKADYATGELFRVSGTSNIYWKEGVKMVCITYDAGYYPQNVPKCIVEGFLDYCYWKFYHRDGGAIEGVGTGTTGASGIRIDRGKLIHGLPEGVYYSILPETAGPR